jgi:exosortase H (IPTLxxWG-CTERM-specific)
VAERAGRARTRPSGKVPIRRRPEVRFLVLFLAILGASFLFVAWKPVDAALVAPYTAFVARLSGAALRLLGEPATVAGCVVSSPRFAVTIFNGCNGLVTSLIFVSGVIAFPARWPAKLLGVVGGLAAIQLINLIRVVSLFFIGIHFPAFFNDAHIVVWQSVVILAGVGLWIAWAGRFGAQGRARP